MKKLYLVSVKCGRSPFQNGAYVEADRPLTAIAKYKKFMNYSDNEIEQDGIRLKASLHKLPENFWQRANYMRDPYIK